jgi:hypothetical protein
MLLGVQGAGARRDSGEKICGDEVKNAKAINFLA